ncbi:MAG TPA: DNA repair protein RecO [Candidatus Saccharimonadales bacterium]|nr:DNA repair protein RecO [Candidatus Saccharimonadales bacterium]
MRQLVTTAIILKRTDYGEADRILTLLTPEYGKLALLAKGVRKVKSKLAGGIELFSVSEITFIKGRGDVGTLVSTRLLKHYAKIVGNLDRTMLGYDLIKQLNKATEDEPEEEYFHVLQAGFEALDDPDIAGDLIRLWFGAQLLKLAGHTPNLETDNQGSRLNAETHYSFSYEHMAFVDNPHHGQFSADHIKFLRLAFSAHPPRVLAQVQGVGKLATPCLQLVQTARSASMQ